MSFTIIVRENKPLPRLQTAAEAQAEPDKAGGLDPWGKAVGGALAGFVGAASDQIYTQTVETLDLGKVIAAVNHRKRERKQRTATTAAK